MYKFTLLAVVLGLGLANYAMLTASLVKAARCQLSLTAGFYLLGAVLACLLISMKCLSLVAESMGRNPSNGAAMGAMLFIAVLLLALLTGAWIAGRNGGASKQ